LLRYKRHHLLLRRFWELHHSMSDKAGKSQVLRILLVNLGIAVVLLLISGALGEWYLRSRAPLANYQGLVRTTSDGLHYEMIPGLDVVKQGVRITTNSDGFRDRDFGKSPGGNEFVIAVLGDSYTFAQGVPQDSTYPAIMERILNEKKPEERFRVWNLGVSGYNTAQESYLLESFVLPRRPQGVVVGYNINDYEPVNVPPSGTDEKSREESETRSGLRALLEDNLFLASYIRYKLGSLIRAIRPDWYHSSYVSDVRQAYRDSDGRWQEVSATLKKMATMCRENGIGFTVALLPAMFDFGQYEFSDIHELVARALADNGIDVLDVAPYFRGKNAAEFHVSLMDSHPNAKAQGIFALLIADHLMDLWKTSAEKSESHGKKSN